MDIENEGADVRVQPDPGQPQIARPLPAIPKGYWISPPNRPLLKQTLPPLSAHPDSTVGPNSRTVPKLTETNPATSSIVENNK